MLKKYNSQVSMLDLAFRDLILRAFSLKSRHFYNPNENKEHLQLIANTFDINIKDEPDYIALPLLEKPLLKKSKLGTMQGIKESVYPIFGEILINTHANKSDLEPFSFEIEIEPNSTSIVDFKKAKHLIERFKPLRDNSIGITLNLPSGEIKTEIATLGDFNIKLDSQMRLHRKFRAKAEFGIIAKWDLAF